MQVFPSDSYLASQAVSFERLYDLGRARRLAKDFLKANRTDLRTWCTYAEMEVKAGKNEEVCLKTSD